jgi:hypothetical protein
MSAKLEAFSCSEDFERVRLQRLMLQRNVAQLIARTALGIDAAMTATIDFKNIPSCGLDLHAVEHVRLGNPLWRQ